MSVVMVYEHLILCRHVDAHTYAKNAFVCIYNIFFGSRYTFHNLNVKKRTYITPLG